MIWWILTTCFALKGPSTDNIYPKLLKETQGYGRFIRTGWAKSRYTEPSKLYYILISVINQLDAQNFLFYNKFISCLYMFRAQLLIIRGSKLHYIASGIITLKQVSGLKLLKYHSLVSVWWYQSMCNAILNAWWWAHVLETCRGMK